MIKPSMEEARALQAGNTIVPVSMELYSDFTTPIEVLKCLKEKSEKCYLLESVEGGEKWGRYSFLGYEPKLDVTCKNGVTVVSDRKGAREYFAENRKLPDDVPVAGPDEVLKKILREYRSPELEYLPPFTGGFVGYISYDYIKYAEKSLQFRSKNTEGYDDLHLMLFDKIIAFDHFRQKMILIVNIKTDRLEENYIDGVVALKEIEALIRGGRTSRQYEAKMLTRFRPLFSKEKYCEMVETVKHHIFEGDIFQAVLSNRMTADFEGDLLPVYRALRTVNPSPYMFYMSFGETQITGASPETLLTLQNGRLHTFPIAGTCPRGENREEDERLTAELLENEKELAEHHMLVDLGRNDLGKISEFGSVQVDEYCKILRFSHVSHLASTVTGKLKQGLDQIDAIGAVFPAGTLSGAPKIRACEIIDGLEAEKRGIYGGAVGYIDFSGNMDMCIAIRMAVKKNRKIHIQAGAGIVADSIPETEHQECLNKAMAMVRAVELSQEEKMFLP